MVKSGAWGIFANIHGDRLFREGAKVQIRVWRGDYERAEVRGLSLGGRRITRYVRRELLSNVRPAWVHGGRVGWDRCFDTRGGAEAEASRIAFDVEVYKARRLASAAKGCARCGRKAAEHDGGKASAAWGCPGFAQPGSVLSSNTSSADG